MVSANREMVVYCFDTLVAHYNSEQAPPPAFDEGEHPLFVTWKKVVNGGEPRLRGCIGTLEARCLINGFRDYALTSALRDRRFPPIQAKELPQLECTVSILIDYETALHYLDWEVGKHGMIIEFTDPDYNTRRSATYLPEVAAHEGWTKTETIDSLMRKAGYNGTITESLRKRIRLTRFGENVWSTILQIFIPERSLNRFFVLEMIVWFSKVLDRGEKIELLVDKTDNLQFQADSFQRQGRQLRRKMWLQNLQMKVMVGGAVLALIIILWLIACKGFKC